jgi:hypothetical protein
MFPPPASHLAQEGFWAVRLGSQALDLEAANPDFRVARPARRTMPDGSDPFHLFPIWRGSGSIDHQPHYYPDEPARTEYCFDRRLSSSLLFRSPNWARYKQYSGRPAYVENFSANSTSRR